MRETFVLCACLPLGSTSRECLPQREPSKGRSGSVGILSLIWCLLSDFTKPKHATQNILQRNVLSWTFPALLLSLWGVEGSEKKNENVFSLAPSLPFRKALLRMQKSLCRSPLRQPLPIESPSVGTAPLHLLCKLFVKLNCL